MSFDSQACGVLQADRDISTTRQNHSKAFSSVKNVYIALLPRKRWRQAVSEIAVKLRIECMNCAQVREANGEMNVASVLDGQAEQFFERYERAVSTVELASPEDEVCTSRYQLLSPCVSATRAPANCTFIGNNKLECRCTRYVGSCAYMSKCANHTVY